MTKKKIPQQTETVNLAINPLFELLRADGSVIVNKALAHAIGLNEAILYCELISRFNYFAERGQLTNDGYFFNTINDLQAGTSLSEKQQRRALNRLEDMNLISTRLQGMPAKRHFKINNNLSTLGLYLQEGKEIMKRFKEYLTAESLINQQLRQKGRSRSEERAELDPPKGQTNNTNNNTNEIERVQPEKEPARAHSSSSDKNLKAAFKESLSLYCSLYNQRYNIKPAISKGKDHALIKQLLDEYGAEAVQFAIKEHLTNPDEWTREGGCTIPQLKHNLPSYLVKYKRYQEQERQQAAQVEANQRRQEEYRKEEEQKQQEEARRAALTDEQRRLEDIHGRQKVLNLLIKLRQTQADEGCQEAKKKVQQYQEELQALADEEAQLQPKAKQA